MSLSDDALAELGDVVFVDGELCEAVTINGTPGIVGEFVDETAAGPEVGGLFFLLPESRLPATWRHTNLVRANGDTHKIAGGQPDGTGVISLQLNRKQ